MSYTSWQYYVMVIVLIIAYYLIPRKFRWLSLLAGSIFFYTQVIFSRKQIIVFLCSIIVSYVAGLILQKLRDADRPKLKKAVLFFGILLSTFPLLLEKLGDFLYGSLLRVPRVSWIIPVGLSFYTLQLVSYQIDIYRGRINAQINPLKYALFASFFPQIIQGPIPRYEQLNKELFEGNSYNYENIKKGAQLVLWGFFLKYMIADKSAVFVNKVFDNYQTYTGVYVIVAAILYSFQLYTDFLSCTTMSQGVSQMFGIHLIDNFNHPYFSTSIKEFWRRWHMSLSSWLRDYIYIPLGGNRRGTICKWINLLITFTVSGFWHGGSWKFLFWGLLHAFYQIIGEVKDKIAAKKKFCFSVIRSRRVSLVLQRICTFVLVMIGWIVFRAESLRVSFVMFKNIMILNPWILFDDSIFNLGLNWKEFFVLVLSLLILYYVSRKQEQGLVVRDWIARQHIIVRWGIYLVAIWVIWICGSYGFGFDAKDFIYGGF